jgi:hypothetical protein
MSNGPLDTQCGDYGEPLPLQNLGILAQAYKGGNTLLPGSLARGWCLRRRDYVVAESATLQQA